MTVDGVMLGVYHLPKIEIDTGTDWLTFGGFFLTVVTVLAGTYVTVKNYRKTLESQEELARRISLKESRQQWINQLRDAAAEFVSHVLVLNQHWKEMPTTQTLLSTMANEDPGAMVQVFHEMGVSLRALRLSAYSLRAKIILLANPKEAEFKVLLLTIDKALSAAESEADMLPYCTEITDRTQAILKVEWDRAKRLE